MMKFRGKIENVPIVDEAMVTKLMGVLSKIAGKVGAVVEGGFYMPVDPATKKTLGFCIVQFVKAADAETAVKSLDNLKLDARHTFKVFPYSAVEAADKTPSEYVAPEVIIPDKPNLRHWLLDSRGTDQFLLHSDRVVEVDWNTIDYTLSWNDPSQKLPERYARKEDFPVNFAVWSPRGSYLVSAHAKGVMVWGGAPPFDKPLGKFEHEGVSKIDFSPGEKFLVTASVDHKKGSKPEDIKEDDPKTVTFHDVAKGKKVLVMPGVKSNMWPLFRWSHDDAYFATVIKDKIQIYDTSTTPPALLGGTSIKVPGVKMISWSPTANILAYYVPEGGERPAGVYLLEVPSKITLRQKQVFDAKDCRLHWHPSGAYLAVKVDRLTGNKKKAKSARVLFGRDMRISLVEQDPDMDPLLLNRKIDELWEKANKKTKDRYEALALEDKERFSKELNFFTTFQIFRMEEKGYPIEELEFDKKDPVQAFAWNPSGPHFAVIHGRSAKSDVSVYEVHKTADLQKLKTLEARSCNSLLWSPVGDFLVLANAKSPAGNLEFVNVRMMESVTTGEHPNATDYEWDPRGRFFVSYCSQWRQQADTGYYMWSFNGRLLAKVAKPKFFEFHWRPRPPTLLTPAEEKKVLKNMKETSKLLEKEDELRRRLEKREFYELRNKQRAEFYQALKEREAEHEARKAQFATLYQRYRNLDESAETIDEQVEKILDEKTTVVQ